jgi:DNA invertase Pin-like site-specific DNA recombinase
MKKIRCAIYTRKSSEDGLEQEFNSLDAQREACAAYVASQIHEGWVLLPETHDDGGLSGGSLERPALQMLLDHVREGRVDQIVVYKIDRLTRSLADFAKIVDILDAASASFVSVTQSFNTATSMGRLTLNMLLSFSQFEREVTAERIRDKITASKRKGLWMGGNVPMGYDPDGRSLKINDSEAKVIRTLFDLYEHHGTIRSVREEAGRLGLRSRRRETLAGKVTGGRPFDRGHIHHILTNPIYAGRIRHRKSIHDGQHAAIIEPERWERIQRQLQDGAARSREMATARQKSLLCGKLFDETGDRLTPSHSKTRTGTRLRYYISHRLVARSGEPHPDAWRLPAAELEKKCAALVRSMLSDHAFAVRLVSANSTEGIGRLRLSLTELLSTRESGSLLCLIERIEITPGKLRISLSAAQLIEDLKISSESLDHDALTSRFPFQLRKRGVETKIILADCPTGKDEALVRNIAKAQSWFGQIRAGKTFAEIATTEGTSKRRIQQMIGLAFLAPDIVRDVLDGRQPLGFTSDWCLRHDLPTDWAEQRQLLATL